MIVFAVSASKINVIDSCFQLYDLTYNRRWAVNENDAPLDLGTVVHSVLAYYYRAKMNGNWFSDPGREGIVLDEATNVGRRTGVDLSISVSEIDEAIGAARQNLIHNRQDGITVHAVEEPFSRILYETPDREGARGEKIHGVRILWEGKVDLIASLPNTPMSVWDHKSESRKSTPSELDNQFEGSAWAFDVDNVIVNKIGFQTSVKEEEKFRRIFLNYRSKEIIEEWRVDVIKSVLGVIERHRREAAGQPDWPRNRTSCNKFSGCRFKPVCKAIPAVREVKLQTWFHIRPEHELYDKALIQTRVTGVEPE